MYPKPVIKNTVKAPLQTQISQRYKQWHGRRKKTVIELPLRNMSPALRTGKIRKFSK
jgi:hypothetical protein